MGTGRSEAPASFTHNKCLVLSHLHADTAAIRAQCCKAAANSWLSLALLHGIHCEPVPDVPVLCCSRTLSMLMLTLHNASSCGPPVLHMQVVNLTGSAGPAPTHCPRTQRMRDANGALRCLLLLSQPLSCQQCLLSGLCTGAARQALLHKFCLPDASPTHDFPCS